MSFLYGGEILGLIMILDVICVCSLRARYGTNIIRNAVHGSKSCQEAMREIKFFFPTGFFFKNKIKDAMYQLAKYLGACIGYCNILCVTFRVSHL